MPVPDVQGAPDLRSDPDVGRARLAEASAEAHSGTLTRVLGLRDIALTQIVFVVGVTWVGAAAKLGNQQIFFWLAAMLLFYLPQAAVVIYLTSRMPFEGGLYQWARIGLSDAMGFMVAWNLWLFAVVLLSSIGLVVSTNLSYVVGGTGSWIAHSPGFISAANVGVIVGLAVLAMIGLRVSRWVHNGGSIALMMAFAVLIGLPFVRAARGAQPAYHPLAVAAPAFTLLSLNIFGKLAVGALSGFEYVAVLAGECKDPTRTIGRGTIIAAPIISVMFILGTSAVLAFVAPADVNLIGPIPQVLRLGFGQGGVGEIIAPAAILLLTMRTLANSSIIFTTTTRLPVVAGWDHLLPQWFTRIHPRLGTPVNSIAVVAVVSILFGLGGIAGVHEQEAYQLLDNAAGIFYGLTYLVLFAVPLIGLRALP
ncbi:MAG TPA: APC family permease, partial [Gemmatimonadaceae bacterium]|nr:APC family permease [Gemmatimonadaceae bacterium]